MLIGIDGNEANVENRVGVGQYAFQLLTQLEKFTSNNLPAGEAGLQFTIYLKDNPLPDLPKEHDRWRYKVVGPKRFWTQFGLPLNLFLSRPRPDVFFSPNHYAPRFCLAPSVISILDLGYFYFPQYFKKSDLTQLKSWTAYSVKQAKKIITISESSKRDVIKFYKKEAKDIIVTYPGYNETFNPRIRKQELRIKKIKEKYKIPGDYILYVGTLQPRKNLVRLIEAFSFLTHNSELITYNLVIAGKKGWLYKEILGKAKELGIGDKVIFTDYVAQEDLPYLMAGAKLYVLPSLYEGFGIPVVEAMASGVPVVCSSVSSLPEVGEGAVVYVDPESVESIAVGIKEVLGWSQSKRDEMVQKGLTQAAKFSWQKCADKTLDVLTKV